MYSRYVDGWSLVEGLLRGLNRTHPCKGWNSIHSFLLMLLDQTYYGKCLITLSTPLFHPLSVIRVASNLLSININHPIKCFLVLGWLITLSYAIQ